MECIVLLLLHDEVLFLLLQLLLQKVDQIVISLCEVLKATSLANDPVALEAGREVYLLCIASLMRRILSLSQFIDFRLESLDDFLAEVGSLGQLLFHFFVDLDFSLVRLDLLLHLVILKDQDLCLLRLVLQLGRQLVVLQNGQVRRRLQLLVVHCQQVRLRLLNVEQHLFSELFCLLDPVKLLLVDLFKTQRFFRVESLFEVGHVLFHVPLLLQECVRFSLLSLHVEYFVLVGFDHNCPFIRTLLPLLVVVLDKLADLLFKGINLLSQLQDELLGGLLLFLGRQLEAIELLILATLRHRQFFDLLLVRSVPLFKLQVSLLDHH